MRFPVKMSAEEWANAVLMLVDQGQIKDVTVYIDLKDKAMEFEFTPVNELIDGRYLVFDRMESVEDNLR